MSNGAEAPQRSSTTMIVVLALLAVVGAAVGFYFIGRSAADASGARADGTRDGEALYASGTPRYKAIYAKGFAAGQAAGTRTGRRQGAELGQRIGLDKGKKIGQLQGQRQGIVQGATAALGGFTDWQPGSFYVVKFAPGQQGVPFVIDSRKLMQTNLRYAICANDPGDVCTETIGGSG